VKDGQIETPLTSTKDGTTSWLSPAQLTDHPACTELELRPERHRAGKVLTRRYAFSGDTHAVTSSEIAYVPPAKLRFTDIVPEQQLGVAACLIPFLSHSDANRMLMGAKNLKQALPLVKPEVPLVQTGMEEIVARLSGEKDERSGDEKEHDRAYVDGKLALGTNLLVAYMPWRGYNFADAIVASDRLVKEDVLTTEHDSEVAFTLANTERVVIHPQVPSHLDQDGTIKPGTIVKAGMILLRTGRLTAVRHNLTSKEKETAQNEGNVYVEGSLTYDTFPHDHLAHIGQEGTVIKVETIKNALGRIWRVIVHLQRRCPLTLGDKLMGRHGNKGVVGKIVPAAQMPTLPDGTPVDLVLNPHGVISRMNLGQLYETHLGWVLRHRTMLPPEEQAKVPEVVAPFDTIPRPQLQQWLQQTGLDEYGKTRLRDGYDGPEFDNPVVVGVQYIVKLDHLPQDKLAVRSTGSYTALTSQPVKGRKFRGGQRVGEMESWALQAHQATALLDEFFTTKADDQQRRRQWQQLRHDRGVIESQRLPAAQSTSLRAAMTLLRAIGIVTEATTARAAESADDEHFRTALRSGGIRWRYCDEENGAISSEQTMSGFLSRFVHVPGAVGHEATVPETREAKTFERVRHARLHCGCEGPVSEIAISDKTNNKVLVCVKHKKKYSEQLQVSVDRWQPCAGGLYDPEVFGTNYPSSSTPSNEREDKSMGADAKRKWHEQFGYIRLAQPMMNPLTKQEMTYLPILPAVFRYQYAADTPGRARLDRPSWKSLDGHYLRIIRSNNRLRELLDETDQASIEAPTRERESKEPKDLEQRRSVAAATLQHALNHLFRGVESRDDVACLERLIKGKHGIFRRAVLGKRNDYSGRAVIVPDPTLGLDECCLPYRMGVELLRPWLRDALLQTATIESHQSPRKVSLSRQADERNARVEAILQSPEEPAHRQAILAVLPHVLGEGAQRRMCVLNRAPSLHKFNVLAFAITELWDEAVIAIPPLVCAGFNADFDGDTMAVLLPVTDAGQKEAHERLVPSANILSPANGKLVLSLAEDIVAGLAYARLDEARAKTTELTKHFRKEVEDTRAPATMPQVAYQRMTEGFAHATQAGLSFGLFDIPVVAEQQEALAEILTKRKRTMTDFYSDKLTESDRIQVADAWRAHVTKEMTTHLQATLNQQPVNTVALLSLTGARGNAATVTQLGGTRGLMQRGSGGTLEYPIESNFLDGLSPLEFFFSAYGSRASLVDKKIQVAPAGDLTRRLVFCAANLRISQNDCRASEPRSILSCKAKEGICKRCYGEEYDTGKLPAIGRPVGLLAATAIGERGTQLSLRTFHTGGVKGDSITKGLAHMNALLENQPVEISHTCWQQYFPDEKQREALLKESKVQLTETGVRLRLSAVARTAVDARTIVLGEAYQNYKREDLPERLFEVILRAMIDRREEKKFTLRGLTAAARENLGALERVAFRDAIRMANLNVVQQKPTVTGGLIERLMIAASLLDQ
jgi:DNA-directed RNA polymerase beta' subunit